MKFVIIIIQANTVLIFLGMCLLRKFLPDLSKKEAMNTPIKKISYEYSIR